MSDSALEFSVVASKFRLFSIKTLHGQCQVHQAQADSLGSVGSGGQSPAPARGALSAVCSLFPVFLLPWTVAHVGSTCCTPVD